MSVLRAALGLGGEQRYSLGQYVQDVSAFQFSGNWYSGGLEQTLANGNAVEAPSPNFVSMVQAAYASNGVVFACMLARRSVFSAVRFAYQRMVNGRGSDLWGDTSLRLLEYPWAGGTTQDLLSRMIQDADLAGNSYWAKDGSDLVRLRPDWVDIVLTPRRLNGGRVGWKKLGYLYTEGGKQAGRDPVPFLADEVAHFAPEPDPLSPFRGMSWLAPIAREIQADGQMTRHKSRFFKNGGTPNAVISYPPEMAKEKLLAFRDVFKAEHEGTENAYRTLHLGGGADYTVVGKDFQQIDFRQVQGAGETRIAAAAGVPPVIVGLSEGLQAATYSNYAQARRRFADGTMHPLWANVAGTMEMLAPAPNRKDRSFSRLWYDSRDVPFLREDEKDAAEIQGRRAATIKQLLDAGFTPETVVPAVDADDMRGLVHSGLYSVQLQPPGTGVPTPPTTGGANA